MESSIRESLSVEEDSITNKFQLVPYDLPPRSGLDEISLSGTDKLVSSFRVSGSNFTIDCSPIISLSSLVPVSKKGRGKWTRKLSLRYRSQTTVIVSL